MWTLLRVHWWHLKLLQGTKCNFVVMQFGFSILTFTCAASSLTSPQIFNFIMTFSFKTLIFLMLAFYIELSSLFKMHLHRSCSFFPFKIFFGNFRHGSTSYRHSHAPLPPLKRFSPFLLPHKSHPALMNFL